MNKKHGMIKQDATEHCQDPELSIVIPCFNESENIPLLCARIRGTMDRLGLSYEVIFIDDGSHDDTDAVIKKECRSDSRLKAVFLSRNFGKETALSAGLRYTAGAAVIPMDSDLQHPPEFIADLVAQWRNGFDVVVAVRNSRETDPYWRNLFSEAFYSVFNSLSDTPIVPGGGDFRLLDRKVVNVLNNLPERSRFLKGLYSWVGFRQTTIAFNVNQRGGGKTTFSLIKLFRYSIDAVTSFSTLPLRIWTAVGTVLTVIGLLYSAYIASSVIIYGREVPGFASLILLIVMFGGIQFLTLGIMGEYLGRIMVEVKARPLFVVRETIGVDSSINPEQPPSH